MVISIGITGKACSRSNIEIENKTKLLDTFYDGPPESYWGWFKWAAILKGEQCREKPLKVFTELGLVQHCSVTCLKHRILFCILNCSPMYLAWMTCLGFVMFMYTPLLVFFSCMECCKTQRLTICVLIVQSCFIIPWDSILTCKSVDTEIGGKIAFRTHFQDSCFSIVTLVCIHITFSH